MNATQRYCLTLELKSDPALIREYEHWHQNGNIWPEIPEGIKAVGILKMDIFRFETTLFMIIEAGAGFDFNRDMATLATLPKQMEWEAFVSQFQKSLPGSTSSEKWKLMHRIFTLD